MNQKRKARLARLAVYAGAGWTLIVLISLVGYILVKGIPQLTPQLFAWKYTSVNVSMLPALINTVMMTALALLIAVPVGMGAAIYLTEYARRGNRLVGVVRVTTETLSGIPSIVYRLFGMLFFSGKLPKNKRHIITSTIEHHAVLYTCEFMQKIGYDVTFVGVDEQGHVKLDELENAITEDTALVSIMAANNEIGTIQDLKAISDICHKHGVLFHTDAVQAVGHMRIDVKEMGIDMLSLSGHKLHAPKGTGALYCRKGIKLEPLIHGGGQERGLRSGTENVAGIVGMATALQEHMKHMAQETKYLNELSGRLIDRLKQNGIDFRINGSNNRIPGSLSLSFNAADGEMLLHRLDLMGTAVATGSACNSKDTVLSHVIQAISVPQEYAHGTIRVTLGMDNTVEQVDRIAQQIASILR